MWLLQQNVGISTADCLEVLADEEFSFVFPSDGEPSLDSNVFPNLDLKQCPAGSLSGNMVDALADTNAVLALSEYSAS